MIPIKLRDQMGLIPGREYYFSVMEKNGRRYICIDCGTIESSTSLEEAMQIVQASGMKIVQSDD